MSQAIEVLHFENDIARYTFRLTPDLQNQEIFRNLVLKIGPNEEVSGYTMSYLPSSDWLETQDPQSAMNLKRFTGKVLFKSLDGDYHNLLVMREGTGKLYAWKGVENEHGRVECGGTPVGDGESIDEGWSDIGGVASVGSGGRDTSNGGSDDTEIYIIYIEYDLPPNGSGDLIARTACGGTTHESSATVGALSPNMIKNISANIEMQLNDLSFQFLRNRYAPRMSPKELNHFDNHLSYSQKFQYLKNAFRADEISMDLDPNYYYGGVNNEWDALRHAYFHGLNSESLGISLSKTLGDLHEDFPTNPRLEKSMDLFNNRIGRETYMILRGQNLTGHFYREGLLIKLLEIMKNGGLREIQNGQLVPTP